MTGVEVIPKDFDGYDYDVLNVSRKLLNFYDELIASKSLSAEKSKRFKTQLDKLKAQTNEDERLLVRFSDLQALQTSLNIYRSEEGQPKLYLHELMKMSVIELPSPPPIKRSAEYEARMEKLKILADEAEYQKMTKNVSFQKSPTENVGQELRKMDSQVTFLLNFVLTVVGAFAFGYKAVEYSLETPNVSLQLTAGMTFATIVFFADIYFIIKEYV